MVKKMFYYIEDMSIILGKTPASIHGHLARKQFDAVPQPIKLGRRLAWNPALVENWIQEKTDRAGGKANPQRNLERPPTKRRGRPRKSERKNGDEQ